MLKAKTFWAILILAISTFFTSIADAESLLDKEQIKNTVLIVLVLT